MQRFLVFIVLCLGLAASAKTEPGSSVNAEPDSLVVMTYNIKVGLGESGLPAPKDPRPTLERIAEFIRSENADLVLLQEVDRFMKRSRELDEVAILGELTEMRTAFAPAITDGEAEYGIAVLSRMPLENVRVVKLPRIDYAETHPTVPGWFSEQRMVLVVRVENGVTAINTHLGLTKEQRLQQTEAIAEIVEEEREAGRAVIVGGDLNAEPDAAELLPLRRLLRDVFHDHRQESGLLSDMPIRTRYTFPAGDPNRCIDYLFVDADTFDVEEAKVPGITLSDHLPVTARLGRR